LRMDTVYTTLEADGGEALGDALDPLLLPPGDPLLQVVEVQRLLALHDRVHVHDVAVAPGDQIVDEEVLGRGHPDLPVEELHLLAAREGALVEGAVTQSHVEVPGALGPPERQARPAAHLDLL